MVFNSVRKINCYVANDLSLIISMNLDKSRIQNTTYSEHVTFIEFKVTSFHVIPCHLQMFHIKIASTYFRALFQSKIEKWKKKNWNQSKRIWWNSIEITFCRRSLVKRNKWQLQLHTKLMFFTSKSSNVNVIRQTFRYLISKLKDKNNVNSLCSSSPFMRHRKCKKTFSIEIHFFSLLVFWFTARN